VKSWNLILATVIIFGAGVITGGLLVDHVIQPHPRTVHRPPVVAVATNRPPVARPVDVFTLRQPQMLTQDFVQKLDDQLQLAPAQRDAIQKIIANGQEQNHTIATNCMAQYHQVLQEVRQRIREQLNPDQLKEFEKLLKQMHPAARRTTSTGTNAVPVLPGVTNTPATNTAPIISTNTPAN
jgi:hypothetical protein